MSSGDDAQRGTLEAANKERQMRNSKPTITPVLLWVDTHTHSNDGSALYYKETMQKAAEKSGDEDERHRETMSVD